MHACPLGPVPSCRSTGFKREKEPVVEHTLFGSGPITDSAVGPVGAQPGLRLPFPGQVSRASNARPAGTSSKGSIVLTTVLNSTSPIAACKIILLSAVYPCLLG